MVLKLWHQYYLQTIRDGDLCPTQVLSVTVCIFKSLLAICIDMCRVKLQLVLFLLYFLCDITKFQVVGTLLILYFSYNS